MAKQDRQSVGMLFKVIGDSLADMDDDKIDLLLQGKATLQFIELPDSSAKRDAGRRKKKNEIRMDESDAQVAAEIARQLCDADTRDAANAVIASIKHRSRKRFLALVADSVGIRIESRDTIAKIESRLIESTVGAKLRARAFAEVPFHGRSPSSVNE